MYGFLIFFSKNLSNYFTSFSRLCFKFEITLSTECTKSTSRYWYTETTSLFFYGKMIHDNKTVSQWWIGDKENISFEFLRYELEFQLISTSFYECSIAPQCRICGKLVHWSKTIFLNVLSGFSHLSEQIQK